MMISQSISPVGIRILGCLVEKELATPEYYPLSLNALTNACNQKSNRDPVMNLPEDQVADGLEELRSRQLIYRSAEGVRTPRYCHHLEGKLHLERRELAVLAILLLRGPQTVGEIRTRCERMYAFADLAEVEQVLQTLSTTETPLVRQLPKQPGRKECRYIDVLRDRMMPEWEGPEEGVSQPSGHDRLMRLEEEVADLRREMAALNEQFDRFKAQFE